MSCTDRTPWTVMDHPYSVNRLWVTGGGGTDQSTGAWAPEVTSSVAICGSLGQAGSSSSTFAVESLTALAGGVFKTGDQYFVCRSDCGVALNDIIECYDDAAGTTKTYWRVVTKLKELTTFRNLRGYGVDYWLVRREER